MNSNQVTGSSFFVPKSFSNRNQANLPYTTLKKASLSLPQQKAKAQGSVRLLYFDGHVRDAENDYSDLESRRNRHVLTIIRFIQQCPKRV